MKDSKNNSFILLDEDEKKRIRMIYSYTQNKEKYKEANAIFIRLLKRTSLFSFRIGNKKDYRFYDKNQTTFYQRVYNHNFRNKDFKTDLMQSDNIPIEIPQEQNTYKHFVDSNSFAKELESRQDTRAKKKQIIQDIKKLRLRLQRAKAKGKLDKVAEIEKEIKILESKKTKIHGNAELFKEIVITCKQDTTAEQIKNALDIVKKEIPLLQPARLINIAIHRDEGRYNDIEGQIQKNYHAHIIFDNIDPTTNKTIFKGIELKKSLHRIQDIMAQELGMQRGERNSKEKHKTKWQLEYQTRKILNNLSQNKDYMNQLAQEQEVRVKTKRADKTYSTLRLFVALATSMST